MALYLTESDVRQVLTLQDALSAVEDAHRWHATGEAIDTPRARSRISGLTVRSLPSMPHTRTQQEHPASPRPLSA